jgi:hypothetical protein
MQVIEFSTLSIPVKILDDIVLLCQQAEQEQTKPAYENMKVKDWETNTNSLLYILQKTSRFSKNQGMFSCLYDQEKLIAISGCYTCDWDTNVVIGGVRAWVVPEYRARYLQSLYLLPAQKRWALENKCAVFALTFNDYNKKLMNIITRSGKYQNKAKKGVGHTRPEFYDNFVLLPKKVIIQYTPQWVIFEKLREYSVNWPYEK